MLFNFDISLIMTIFQEKKIATRRNKKEKKRKIINLVDLYFNSFQKHKYLPEQTNKEIKASPNEIRSIQNSDLYVAILKSLTYKDIISTVRKKDNNNNNIDFIKIPKVKLKGYLSM